MSATTVDSVARAALNAINSDAGLVRAVKYTSHRYRELTSDGKLRALRKLGELIIPAIVNTGTVTTTRDSAVVTGNAAAQAVWPPSSDPPSPSFKKITLLSCPPMSMTVRAAGIKKFTPLAWQIISVTALFAKATPLRP